ncbi:hypothetical protein P171DRAFT_490621 [Karstenula rhodostoma CBS 690.94]|uniref:Uncharacterized protein n=1 Tax=Karstenula rhodostoma CBS 690.94 TaxID=1392251 RepID=A0A9P4P8E2_9PLEO|nr:hypothetical protein P171DRAFT_490621 [Karstenula rhodostoma CBS 690.94]
MPPISQFPPARVFLKMPPAIKTQAGSGARRGSLMTTPTGRAALTQNNTSTTLPPRVASTTKFSTTTSIGREAGTAV